MPYVMQHPNKTYLVSKDSWATKWSDDINQARIFQTLGATTRARRTLNDGFSNPVEIEALVLKVKIKLEPS